VAWHHVETDERHRKVWIVWRCGLCKRLAVTEYGPPQSLCVCMRKQ